MILKIEMYGLLLSYQLLGFVLYFFFHFEIKFHI